MVGGHIHWYITDRCNIRCGYCFKPKFLYNKAENGNLAIAHILADTDVAKVTLGGGEPTLAKDLVEVIHILKQAGKYVSIHTNGILLDDNLLSELEVDDIALPLDSLDRNVQRELRGEKFLKTFDKFSYFASKIQAKNIRLGYHTVFTAINYQNMPEIYDAINLNGFDYWRIYEFNDNLALKSTFDESKSQKKLAERIKKIETLAGKGTSEKGFTDCLLAKFLLTEQKMKKFNDSRIQFVGRNDVSEPYTFLDNCGNISYYTWLSQGTRRVIGNIFSDSYQIIRKRLQEVHDKGWEFDNETEDGFWWATVGNMPIWARLWDGNYFHEELEEIDSAFLEDVVKLSELHKRKNFERVLV